MVTRQITGILHLPYDEDLRKRTFAEFSQSFTKFLQEALRTFLLCSVFVSRRKMQNFQNPSGSYPAPSLTPLLQLWVVKYCE